MNQNLSKRWLAEFIGTFALMFIGVGAIRNDKLGVGMGLLGVALAHGLTIARMVSATGAIPGGHLNPAVACSNLGNHRRGIGRCDLRTFSHQGK